jgi:ribosome-binding ATPase
MLIGLVGKPSSGKSTFFNAATLAGAPTASYPFTTIEPNKGTGFVRVKCACKDLNTQCNPRHGYCKNGTRFVPVELVDVAGLIPGAHEGKGLGNKFLNDLNQADVLIHIIDCSGTTNEKGEPCPSHDPCKDVEFLEKELDMWYFSILKKGWVKFARKLQQSKIDIADALAEQMSSFKVKSKTVDSAITILNLDKEKPLGWSEQDMKNLATELRKSTKPIIVACNKMDLPNSEQNYEKLKSTFPNYTFIPCAADFELALREASEKSMIDYMPGDADFKIIDKEKLNEKQTSALEYIKNNILIKFNSTGVQEVLDKAVFEFLHYLAIFPGGMKKLEDKDGNRLPDCFLLPPNTTAFKFAEHIHSDLAQHFLYAMDVRTRMKIGKDHPLKNLDVIEIISAAK